MLKKVKERLKTLGYKFKKEDEMLLTFSIHKAENTVKNDCNITKIPDELMYIVIDMVVGEFLKAKKTFGDIDGFDLDYAVKQIQTGDTSVTFAAGDSSLTPEQRLDSFIKHLSTYGRNQFSCFRRLRW